MQNKAGFWVFIFPSAAGLFHLQQDGNKWPGGNHHFPLYLVDASHHHIIANLRSPKSIRNYATLTDVHIRPGPWCRVSAMDRRWSKHNSEYTMTSARRSEGLPNFHPFVSFLCICQKIKILLRQTFPEPILWELITPGDVRNPSSDHWTLNSLSFGWK